MFKFKVLNGEKMDWLVEGKILEWVGWSRVDIGMEIWVQNC